MIGIGNRLPQEMKVKLRGMIEADVAIPSLSHYVAYVLVQRFTMFADLRTASSMHGSLVTTHHPSITCTDISITLCTIETAPFINMPY